MRLVEMDLGRRNELAAGLAEVGCSRNQLLEYLRGGVVVCSSMLRRPDRIDSTRTPIWVSFLTDGVWVWPGELTAYVERDNLGVELEFLRFVAARPEREQFLPRESIAQALAVLGITDELGLVEGSRVSS